MFALQAKVALLVRQVLIKQNLPSHENRKQHMLRVFMDTASDTLAATVDGPSPPPT